jgi:DNA (cytosine-5)-methyltransferase 1
MVQSVAGSIAHALDTANNGKGSSEDGTGKGVPIIAFTAQGNGADATIDLTPTLRAGGHRNSHANAGVVPAIAFAQNNRGEVRFESGHGQVACTVLSNGKPGYGVPMVACVALRGRPQGLAAELGGSVAAALRTSGGGADKPHVLAPDFEAHFRYDWNDPRPRRLVALAGAAADAHGVRAAAGHARRLHADPIPRQACRGTLRATRRSATPWPSRAWLGWATG